MNFQKLFHKVLFEFQILGGSLLSIGLLIA